MNRLLRADRDQMVLHSRTIAESLKADHEVFGFARLIDTLDLKDFRKKYSPEGGKAYDPSLILSLLIYGYHRGWRSSRELQRACEENTAMRYLVGDHKIKFRAIAEFRVNFADEISDVFKQSVSQVVKRRPTVGKDVKVDGTKIKACAANDQTYTRQELEARKAELDKKILDYLNGGIEDDKRDDAELGDNVGYEMDTEETQKRIHDFVANQKQLLKERRAAEPQPTPKVKPEKPVDPNQQEMFTVAHKLEKINTALSSTDDKSSDCKINLTDTDARFMKNRGKILQSYNVQVASSEGFVVAADIASNNCENDLKEMAQALERAMENTQVTIEKATADSGYFYHTALQFFEEHQIDGYIPSPQQISKERKGEEDTGFESHHFEYNKKSNTYICPQGKPLNFHRQFKRDGNDYFRFHCKPLHCVQCPVREKCCTTKEDIQRGYRSLELGEEHALKHAMILKMKSDEAKKACKRRGAEIEPIFGNWKSLRNFWFFLLRGRKKALTEVKITATATNFGKLVRLAIA